MTINVTLLELETEVQVTSSLYSTVVEYLQEDVINSGESIHLLLGYDTIGLM